MFKETLKDYYNSPKDLNCAEAILYAANDFYDMRLEKETLKVMAGFGGGMAVEGVCGAVSGGVAVLSLLFVQDRGHEGNLIKELTVEFFHRVEKIMGSSNCRELKELYRTDDAKCSHIVEVVAEILDEMILEQLEKGKGTNQLVDPASPLLQ